MTEKVLIVEDHAPLQEVWKLALRGKVEIISAFSIEEAKEKFAANPDIVAIIVDACVPGSEPNTMSLLREFRATFNGLIIATSNVPEYRQDLVLAGCDIECEKHSVPKNLELFLGLS